LKGGRGVARRIVTALGVVTPLATVGAPVARAQTGADSSGKIVGRVLYAGRDAPVGFASVTVSPPGRSRFADSAGAFAFVRVAPGFYHVKARQIGFSPFDTLVEVRPAPAVTTLTLRLKHVPVLTRITTRAKAPKDCIAPGVPDSAVDPELAMLFQQVRENVVRLRILTNEYPFRYRRENEYFERGGRGPDVMTEADTIEGESWHEQPYEPGEVVVNGNDQHGQPGQFMHLVQFQDLADKAFEDTHCWRIADRDPNDDSEHPLLRIDFRPAAAMGFPDIEGSIYIDPDRYIVKHARFHLTRSGMASPPIHDWTYYSSYREIVPLVPVVSGFQSFVQAGRPGTMVEEGRLLDISYVHDAPIDPSVKDTVAGATATRLVVGKVEFPGQGDDAPACNPPTSQTIVESLTASLFGPTAVSTDPSWATTARALLAQIQSRLSLPSTMDLSTFGYGTPASAEDAAGRGALRVAPAIVGRYALSVDSSGHVDDVRITTTTTTGAIDSAVVDAASGAESDRLRGRTVILALSTLPRVDTTASLQFVHIQVPSWILTRPATVVTPAGATATPARSAAQDSVVVEFIVDPSGYALLPTVHRVSSSTDVLADPGMDLATEAAADSLSARVYRPALIGRCAVSQISTARFAIRRPTQ
jgi:hypothetical protein